MKLITRTIQFLALFILLTAAACQDKYPDLKDGLYAEIVTNKGTMVLELEYKKAPITVANFVSLAEGTNTLVDSTFKGKKYYNGLTFHRIIDEFMIQGGDPTGTGSGSPGYKFNDEISPDLKHDKVGTLSMANSGPNTNGSQFFITEKETPFLDGGYNVFGYLVMGEDILHTIAGVKTTKPGDKPEEPVVMKEVNIIRKGKEAKDFDAPKIFKDHFAEAEKAEKEHLVKMEEE
ncbi:MAG: peptidylprolyl isomerase, partial [Aquaticitalea sp.]